VRNTWLQHVYIIPAGIRPLEGSTEQMGHLRDKICKYIWIAIAIEKSWVHWYPWSEFKIFFFPD